MFHDLSLVRILLNAPSGYFLSSYLSYCRARIPVNANSRPPRTSSLSLTDGPNPLSPGLLAFPPSPLYSPKQSRAQPTFLRAANLAGLVRWVRIANFWLPASFGCG